MQAHTDQPPLIFAIAAINASNRVAVTIQIRSDPADDG